jgi:hypothetical protein
VHVPELPVHAHKEAMLWHIHICGARRDLPSWLGRAHLSTCRILHGFAKIEVAELFAEPNSYTASHKK